jgi:hypothetical protein
MVSLIILMLFVCGFAVLCCLANHWCHSGFPAVSLWFFRTGADRES